MRHFLIRGAVLGGVAAAVFFFNGGTLGIRPLVAASVSGLSRLAGAPAQPTYMNQESTWRTSAGDCHPFPCANTPHWKWMSAPPKDPAAVDEPYRPPEPLIIRSALTGEPYPAPDKPAIFPGSAYSLRGPGFLTILSRGSSP